MKNQSLNYLAAGIMLFKGGMEEQGAKLISKALSTEGIDAVTAAIAKAAGQEWEPGRLTASQRTELSKVVAEALDEDLEDDRVGEELRIEVESSADEDDDEVEVASEDEDDDMEAAVKAKAKASVERRRRTARNLASLIKGN